MSESGSNIAEYTVSEIAGAVKRTVEETFGYVRIRGEITGFRGPHSSGHAYFALKDEKARIDAVIWRGQYAKLKIKPEEGLEVIASGKLTTFPGSSKYQVVIDRIEPAGVGALMALIEERKKKFAAEGLFDADRKIPIPYLPKVIGVVTSPTGAVIRDIMHRLRDRFPTHVLVWPVRVQGDKCGDEVAAAINGFNALEPGGKIPRPDTIIVARGGGSLEDLWGFHDEVVVRAVAASTIPVISAVGHETDWTLIDYVADLRAPTPTGAAEKAVPVRSDLIATTGDLGSRSSTAMARMLELLRTKFRAAERGLPSPQEILAQPGQRLDLASARLSPQRLQQHLDLLRQSLSSLAGRNSTALEIHTQSKRGQLSTITSRFRSELITQKTTLFRERLQERTARLERGCRQALENNRNRLDNADRLLKTLSYQGVLQRGFALVRKNGAPIQSVSGVSSGDVIELEFHDGRTTAIAGEPGISAKIQTATVGVMGQSTISADDISDKLQDLAKPKKRKRKAKSSPSKGAGQGSLFQD